MRCLDAAGDVDNSGGNRDRIIELSKLGNVLHPLTAFIGVSDQDNQRLINPAQFARPDQQRYARERERTMPTRQILGGFTPQLLPPAGRAFPRSKGGSSIPFSQPAGSCPPRKQMLSAPTPPPPEAECALADSFVPPKRQFRKDNSEKTMLLSDNAAKKVSKSKADTHHENLIDLANFDGTWDDSDRLWKTLQQYVSKLSPEELRKYCLVRKF